MSRLNQYRNFRPICVRTRYFGSYRIYVNTYEGTYLNFDLSLHLHPYFAYASSEESREYMRRLVRAMAAL